AAAGALVAPGCTTEEAYLAARLMRGLGSGNIDHRLRRQDFRDQQADPAYPSLGRRIAELEQLSSILIIGSQLRSEMPMLAHRVRKAALSGGRVGFINPVRYEYLFPVQAYVETGDDGMTAALAAVL